jgi:hypothetical protein
MKKKLTKDHIEKGEKRSAETCPIALCLREALPGARIITVDLDDPDDAEEAAPFVMVDGHQVEFAHPEKVVKFVRNFDHGKKVNSFFLEWEDF